MSKISSKSFLSKLMYNLWKNFGGCPSCFWQLETGQKISAELHRCSLHYDPEIKIRVKE